MIGWRKHRMRIELCRVNGNYGWHLYYVGRFNKTQHPDAALLAMYHLFLALRDGEVT